MTREKLVELLELHDRSIELKEEIGKLELLQAHKLTHLYLYGDLGRNYSPISIDHLSESDYSEIINKELAWLRSELEAVTKEFEKQ
jgi:hypothetical protein